MFSKNTVNIIYNDLDDSVQGSESTCSVVSPGNKLLLLKEEVSEWEENASVLPLLTLRYIESSF